MISSVEKVKESESLLIRKTDKDSFHSDIGYKINCANELCTYGLFYILQLLNLFKSSTNRSFMNQNTKPYLDNFVAYLEANKDKQNLVNTAKMAKFLDPLSDQKNYMINFHWNPTGWFTLLGVHSEDSTLHLNFSATYLVKPTLLETFYFLRRPDLSFLRMEYKGLEPTGINDYENGERPEREEYVECLGNLYSRSCWDEGRTEDGRTIGLEAELQVRELKDGTFMIIPKGNLLNTSDFDAHRNDIAASGRNSSVLQELIRRFG